MTEPKNPKLLTCEDVFRKAKEIEFGMIIQECTVQNGKIIMSKITVQEVTRRKAEK